MQQSRKWVKRTMVKRCTNQMSVALGPFLLLIMIQCPHHMRPRHTSLALLLLVGTQQLLITFRDGLRNAPVHAVVSSTR